MLFFLIKGDIMTIEQIKESVEKIIKTLYGPEAYVLEVTEHASLTVRNIHGYKEAVIHNLIWREDGDPSTIMLDQSEVGEDISLMQHKFNATAQFKMSFTLFDNDTASDGHLNGSIDLDGTTWVNIKLNGFSTASSEGSEIIALELYEGKPMLRVWADINQEDPTHNIDLSGALETKRDDFWF
jgi:hypothetical protein